MKQFAQGGVEVWIDTLPKLGVVIYDPRSQEDLPANRVRLYISDQERMGTFARAIVAERLTASNLDAGDEQLAQAAEDYLSLRRRYARCYSCKKSINSVEFAVCRKCRWIKCACGACGCGFHG
jgi:hypothetical protein